jgi:demethylmenaquinone methyltransferase/2-methoxy-6-polyprenyl-1,4-benzoquinol methylase
VDYARSRSLFDDNAGTYDRVNTIISLGLDARWRRWAARQAAWTPGATVLDAFAGTGRVGIETAALGAKVTMADASPGMLDVAMSEAARRGVVLRCVLTDLTARVLPFEPRSFDAVTVSFGVRYLDSPAEVLRRLGGLLKRNGRLVVLEFVRPPRGLVSRAAAVYFFRMLPWIAGQLAGRRRLYDYLASSTLAVGHADDLAALCRTAGFDVHSRRTMGFGLVAGLVCVPRD